MFCPYCGDPVPDDAATCPGCGQTLPVVTALTDNMQDAVSPKSRIALSLLAFFIGSLGIHRFYAGRTPSGICMLALFLLNFIPIVWTQLAGLILFIWGIIDFILALSGYFKDGDGKRIQSWAGAPQPPAHPR